MAVYTTFFAGNEVDLDEGFLGWRRPLAAPVKRTSVNPFTKQSYTYDDWEPEDDDVGDEPAFPRKLVTAIKGDYAAYLEGRLPDRVRSLQHLAVKSVLSPQVDELLAVLAKEGVDRLHPARFPPRRAESGAMLDVLPDAGVLVLAKSTDGELVDAARQLSTEGLFADDRWPADACADLFRSLRGLAIQATRRTLRMFLLTEP
jgi:hypothetical protein